MERWLPWILTLVVVVGAVIVWSIFAKRENFTITEIDHKPCMYPIQEVDDDLLPNSTLLTLSDYNYLETPVIYRDGKKITPLNFYRDYVDMLYYFTVNSPKGVCGHTWTIETSDFVEPVVSDGRSNKQLSVSLEERADGHNLWKITC